MKAAPRKAYFSIVRLLTFISILLDKIKKPAYRMELNRFSILPVKASEAKSSLCCVEIQSNAPPNPSKMPKTFLPVTFSFRNKAEIKKTFTGPDKLRAVCSVILNDCFLVKNVRVVEGEKGLFVSLPSRRNVKGEWVEHCFPMTKELRAKLSAAVLEAYEAAVQNEEAAVS